MIDSLTIPDPMSALMLTHLDVGRDGRVHSHHDLRRRQRRTQRLARLRKLFA